jgi:hypothetical protein
VNGSSLERDGTVRVLLSGGGEIIHQIYRRPCPLQEFFAALQAEAEANGEVKITLAQRIARARSRRGG